MSEGVVFGADSTTTIAGAHGVMQLNNHAQKVFEVGPPGDGRMAVCTYGAGKAGKTSHRTIAARLADHVTGDMTVAAAAQELVAIVERAVAAAGSSAPGGVLGYFLGGIDPVTRDPSCFRIVFDNGKHQETAPLKVGEARFEGAPSLWMRAKYGFDPELVAALAGELAKRLPAPPSNFLDIFKESLKAAMKPSDGWEDLPIREAIDFCHTYLHLTVKGFKFRFGPPVVGGPIELGFITTDRLFRWVRHKDFDSAILEQEGGML